MALKNYSIKIYINLINNLKILWINFIQFFVPKQPIPTLRKYIDTINETNLESRMPIYLSLSVIIVEILKRLYLFQFALTNDGTVKCSLKRITILNFDFIYYLLPSKHASCQLMYIAVMLNQIQYVRIFYFRTTRKYYFYLYDILINRNLIDYFYLTEYRNQLVLDIINRYYCLTLRFGFIFQINTIGMLIHTLTIMLPELIAFNNDVNNNDQHFQWYENIWFIWNIFSTGFIIFYYCNSNLLGISIFNAFLTIVYIQTNQIYQLLLNQLNNKKGYKSKLIKRYRYYQYRFLRMFHGINCSINGLFLAFLLANCPNNAIMIIWIMFGQLEWPLNVLICFVIFDQLFAMFFLHYTLAKVAKWIHRPSKILLKICSFTQLESNHNLNRKRKYSKRTRLHLEQLVALLHTNNCYGLTYEQFGLITMYSFGRVSFPI